VKRCVAIGAIVLAVAVAVSAGVWAFKAAVRARQPRIRIEAYYPFVREDFFIADYLEELAAQRPGKIVFEYICYGSDEGYERWRKTGLECGGVFINGRNEFPVLQDGEMKNVAFVKRMGVYWTREQFEAALAGVVAEVYP